MADSPRVRQLRDPEPQPLSDGDTARAGAGLRMPELGSSGRFVQVPPNIGHQPGRQVPHPNSFGDAAAAAASSSVQQIPTGYDRPQAPAPAAAAPAPTAPAATAPAASMVDQIPRGYGGPIPAPQPTSQLREALDTDLGRNITNTLTALPGARGLVGAASAGGGAISKILNTGLLRTTNAGLTTPALMEDMRSGATPGATSSAAAQPPAAQPPAAQPPAAKPPAAQPTDPSTPTNDVTKTVGPDGHVTYSGGNVAGDITINGRAPGGGTISAQNMAAADALAGREQLRALGGAALAQPAQFAQAPTVLHSGNDWASRNALRNLEVSASSITNNGGRFDENRGTSTARKAYAAALGEDLKRQGAQPALDMETIKSNSSLRGAMAQADATRYSTDQKLRGGMYEAAGRRADAQAAAQTAATKYATELGFKVNDEQRKAIAGTLQRHRVAGADGKEDPVATQRLVSMMDQVIPGYSTMSPQAQARYQKHADALGDLYMRMRDQKSLNPLTDLFSSKPQLTGMRDDLKGGKRAQQGLLTGWAWGQSGVGGHYIKTPQGEINLGTGLNDLQLQMIDKALKTGKFIDEDTFK